MKILITGGAGFIGRWIVKKYLDNNHKVVVYDNLVTGSKQNIKEFVNNSYFKFIQGDILNKKLLNEAFLDVDLCIHLAAQLNVQESLENPSKSIENNILGTYNILNCCKEFNIKLVLMGTCIIYSIANKPINELHLVKPVSPYAASKLAAEELALSYHYAYNLPLIILRPFNTYGPFQKTDIKQGSVINFFISKKLKGENLTVMGTGLQTRDFLYVEDCAEFVYLAAFSNLYNGTILNAGSGKDVSIKDLAKLIQPDFDKVKMIIHHHPNSEINKLLCDYSKAKYLLDWKPKIDLKDGIKRTENWLIEQGNEYNPVDEQLVSESSKNFELNKSDLVIDNFDLNNVNLNNKDLSKEILLVVAPHPDDEVLGCGGLIRKVKKVGGKVYVLMVTVGNQQQYGSVSNTNTRLGEIKKVMNYLEVDGYDLVLPGDDYHLRLENIPQKIIIDLIEKGSKVSLENVKPTIVALPFKHSYFQDHRAVFEAGFAAVRPRPSEHKHTPRMVLSYEQPDVYWSEGNFNPNFFVDISCELDEKLKALTLYSSQNHVDPHPCSLNNIKNIALVRGKQICVNAAEAYICYRNVI